MNLMDELNLPENPFASLLPTYAMLTADRVFAYFNIQLNASEQLQAIKDSDNLYHQLLRVPFKNLVNGIILQQAQDYQNYLQKLLIDYLMSGEANADNEGTGKNARDAIEDARTKTITSNETLEKMRQQHQQFINDSQLMLKPLAAEIILASITLDEVKAHLASSIEQASAICSQCKTLRHDLRNHIILVADLLVQLMPEYRIDPTIDLENRDTLHFDDKIV
jgi:hypothetical protein